MCFDLPWKSRVGGILGGPFLESLVIFVRSRWSTKRKMCSVSTAVGGKPCPKGSSWTVAIETRLPLLTCVLIFSYTKLCVGFGQFVEGTLKEPHKRVVIKSSFLWQVQTWTFANLANTWRVFFRHGHQLHLGRKRPKLPGRQVRNPRG